MVKRHYYELDRLNVLLCLIVVFIHAFGGIVQMLDPNNFLHMMSLSVLRNCAFAVQGFIFLSALKYGVAADKGKFRYGAFLIKRIRKVLLPYIISVAVYYICFCSLDYFEEGFSTPVLLRYIYDGTLAAHFYFVIVIMQFYLLMPLWTRAVRRLPAPVIVISGIIIYCIWVICFAGKTELYDRIFITYIPFWMAGLAAGKNYSGFTNLIKKDVVKITAAFIMLAIIDGSGFYITENTLITAYFFEIIHMLYAFSAILFTSAVCMYTDSKLSFFTGAVNSLSYEIYLWHCLLLTYIDRFIDIISPASVRGFAAIRVGGIYIIIFAFCLVHAAVKAGINGRRTASGRNRQKHNKERF
ncbi:MAG: acyltransferase [Clostridia bacterium]|nr:acyltransferase [Clostridia bacterium]